MRICTLFSFIFLLFIFHSDLNAISSIQNKRHKTSIPFELYNNIMVVNVEINHSKTLRFIFDSGCRSTIVLQPKWLDSFEIAFDEKVFFSGLGLKDTIETLKVEKCFYSLGDFENKNVAIYFLNKDTLTLENYLGTPVDGLFGADIFNSYYVHINYKRHLIELYEKRPSKKINNTFRKLPLSIRLSKGYYTCVLMNENGSLFESELLLDTGANLPILIKNTSPEELGVNDYKEVEIGEGLAGPLVAKVGRTKTLFFDTLKFDNPVTCFSETPLYVHEKHEDVLNGNIGNDILSRLDVYYAYPEKCIYYRTQKNTHEPFVFNISNIILLQQKTNNGGYIVKNIVSTSPPAKLGLGIGDEILEINGTKTENISMSDALYQLNRKVGKKISITFKHNNEIKKIIYKLESVI